MKTRQISNITSHIGTSFEVWSRFWILNQVSKSDLLNPDDNPE